MTQKNERADSRWITLLRRGLKRLEHGHHEPLPTGADGDAGALAEDFNRLAGALAARQTRLHEQYAALAASVQRSEALLDAANDGIAFLSQGRLALVNRRFAEMLGVSVSALQKRTASEAVAILGERVVGPERLRRVFDLPGAEDDGAAAERIEEVIETKGAERRFLQVYTAPVRTEGSETAGRIIALHDITREIELDRLKNDFISVVSHELRTPLTSIKGYTDLILSGQTGEINELQSEFLGIVQASSTRLSNLINDILDISRIEAGRMDVRCEPLEYERIVSDALRLMKAAADEKEISLDAAFPQNLPRVYGDAAKVTQILSNLLSNAIKYTPEGGWVKVSLEASGDAVRTCVADGGIGISAEDQKRLFQKFFRADNSPTREAGGTGLGLVIVKSTVELLGGFIWLESAPGSGSKFYFTLPTVGDEQGGAGKAVPALLPERGIGLILVVEAENYARERVQQALHRRGYGVLVAASAEIALHEARLHRPDLVLLDMMLPGQGGLAALRALRGDPATRSLPIVTFSLDGNAGRERMALGAVSFLRKPGDAPKLAAALRGRSLTPHLLIAAFGERAREEARALGAFFARAGVTAAITPGAEAAIAAVVAGQPAAVLIEADGTEEAALMGFLRALKSEEDLARIPVLFLLDDAADGLHFHWGYSGANEAEVVDYLAEQAAKALRGDTLLRLPTIGYDKGTA